MADKAARSAGTSGGDSGGRFEDLDKAVSELATAAVPLVHQVIEVVQANLDPMSAAAKDLLGAAGRHAEPLIKAGAQLASAGIRQAVTIAKLPVSPAAATAPSDRTTARKAGREQRD